MKRLLIILFCLVHCNVFGAVILSDDFNDGNATGWTTVSNSSYGTPSWQVIGGVYKQVNDIKGFDRSYHLGAYSYYTAGLSLTDYSVNVTIIPGLATVRDTVGVMFRYQDNNNYYRLSMSRFQGFYRLEKKVGGTFSPLAVTGRGPVEGVVQNVSIDIIGSKIFCSINGSVIFSIEDSSIAAGSVALYCMGQAQFDDVVIVDDAVTAPRVAITAPLAYSVMNSGVVDVAAIAVNIPQNGSVQFWLDDTFSSGLLQTPPFTAQFPGVSAGNHTLSAIVYDDLSNQVAIDATKTNVGVDGTIIVAIGDSITNGTQDNLAADDSATNGRNIGRGFTPILAGALETGLQYPVMVYNEGLGGLKSSDGAANVASTIDRYPDADYWLILYGTNDATPTLFTPSGESCTEVDLAAGLSECDGTYKQYLRTMILTLKGSGRIPLLAKVPYIGDATTTEDTRIQSYNIVIDQLIVEHSLQTPAPDLYSFFANNPAQLADFTHPTGQGYASLAGLWYDELTDPSTGVFTLAITDPPPPTGGNGSVFSASFY
ncbi:MAG: GDSL-type esterase/lipase family protein [Desulforhopalus sp.]